RAAWDQTNAVGSSEMPSRISVLVDERKACGSHLCERAEAKAEQNAPLDPRIHAPSRGRGRVGRGSAYLAVLDCATQREESRHGIGIAQRSRSGGKVPL